MNRPLITILGATASGKTKLSLALAQRYKAEIISADSMQIYSGLDIATAKATIEERQLVRHHLIDYVDPLDENYTVQNFRREGLAVLNELGKEDKMAVIVGGTNYYIESLLWDFTISSDEDVEGGFHIEREDSFRGISTQELYEKLESHDQAVAEKLHPNNRRKIISALKHTQKSSTTLSHKLKIQHGVDENADDCDGVIRGRLRNPKSLALLIDCEPKVLEQRIRDRVDAMLSQGLLKELEVFNDKFADHRRNGIEGYETGIFQVLGLKEFHTYFSLSISERETDKGMRILKDSIELLKQRSVRYSKSQLKWIHKRILKEEDESRRLPVYRLDSTDVANWEEDVENKAFAIVDSYLHGNKCEFSPMDQNNKRQSDPHKRFECSVCRKILIGEVTYREHLVGKAHKALAKRA